MGERGYCLLTLRGALEFLNVLDPASALRGTAATVTRPLMPPSPMLRAQKDEKHDKSLAAMVPRFWNSSDLDSCSNPRCFWCVSPLHYRLNN
jgi:hypothetical protein